MKNKKLLKYSELVYPVHNKGSASVVDPKGPHDRQKQGEAGREEAQNLIGQAHGLSRGQCRVPDLQDPLAGRQRLLQAAVLSYEVLIKMNFSLFHIKK